MRYGDHRFNKSYRDIEEELLMRGMVVSYETIRQWSLKFGYQFSYVIKKRGYKRGKHPDKWHLDEMFTKVNGETFYLWHAVDANGYELDVLLQKRRNKKSAHQAQNVIAWMGQTRNLFCASDWTL